VKNILFLEQYDQSSKLAFTHSGRHKIRGKKEKTNQKQGWPAIANEMESKVRIRTPSQHDLVRIKKVQEMKQWLI
jgi:hypothetical protein